MPLPPYIRRAPESLDRERYQTVYARVDGSVAAPTAGLHFDEDMLTALRAQGVITATITLHVGAGTFQPLREECVESHVMHPERVVVPTTVVSVDSDVLAPPWLVQELVERAPGVEDHYLISSPCGHDAFLKESAEVSRILGEILQRAEVAR